MPVGISPEAPVENSRAGMAVSFNDAFRQRQHHRQGVFGDRFLVAARLIDHSNPGLGASVDINCVIAGPVRRRSDQVWRTGEQSVLTWRGGAMICREAPI